MERTSENQELKNKIQAFVKNKHFENPFIQECIAEFIEGHTKLYGDVISQEDLFKRLENNLDKIVFAGAEKAPNGELAEYKGRIADNTDANEILIYSDESDLSLSETDKKMWSLYTEADKQKLLQDVEIKKSEIKSTLIHELTHSAYTIKDEYGLGEQHIFSRTSKDYLSGEYRQIGGNSNNVEAIVNYISSKIEGKNVDDLATYQAETRAIYMLAQKLDEKTIIQASWNSNEQQFKQAYINSIGTDNEAGEQSYTSFQRAMKKLVVIRNQKLSISEEKQKNKETLSEMQQILDGKSNEIESMKFRDIDHTMKTVESLSTDVAQEKLSFPQKIASFFKKHNSLMNIPLVKGFVEKQLNFLPPAREQEEKSDSTSSYSQRDKFINELTDDVEYRKLGTIKITQQKQIQDINKTNEQIIDETER